MKLIQLLLEYDRNVTINNFKSKLIPKLKQDRLFQQVLATKITGDRMVSESDMIQLAITMFERADPTNHKQYVPWLVRTYCNSDMSVEDAVTRIGYALVKYERMKNRRDILPVDKRDINKFKTFAEFESVIDQYAANDTPQAKDLPKGESKEVYKDSNFRVVELLNLTAAKYYGQGTKWCTAADKNNMFASYNSRGPVYVIFDLAHNRKWQAHARSAQIMDEQDNNANGQELAAVPGLVKWIYDNLHLVIVDSVVTSKDIAPIVLEGLRAINLSDDLLTKCDPDLVKEIIGGLIGLIESHPESIVIDSTPMTIDDDSEIGGELLTQIEELVRDKVVLSKMYMMDEVITVALAIGNLVAEFSAWQIFDLIKDRIQTAD